MSKDKAEEKAMAYAGITPDVNNVDQLPNQFVFVKTKYFSFVAGYTQAITDLSAENAQLREALREIIKECEEWVIPGADRSNNCENNHYVEIADLKSLIDKAKQLLTDNTKEDETDKV